MNENIPLKKTGKPFHRPLKEIDWKKADELMIAGCIGTEVASYFGMHPDTFYRRVELEKGISFTAYLQEKQSKGEALLRAHQYAKSLGLTDKGDNTLLIWLGKTRLKQRETELNSANLEDTKKFDKLMDKLESLQDERKIADKTCKIDPIS